MKTIMVAGLMALLWLSAQPAQAKKFKSEEVTIQADGHTLAGTITRPKKKGAYPALVLLSGSGPTDRNETAFGFEIFRVIAEHLSSHGFVVLRYDDRGVGSSTGDYASADMADFAHDAETAFNWLRTQSFVDPAQVGLMGHSEGGYIAPMVAAQNDQVAFLVLMAPGLLPGDQLLREQSKKLIFGMGGNSDLVDTQMKIFDWTFAAIRGESTWEQCADSLGKMVGAQYDGLPTETQEQLGDREEFIRSNVEKTLPAFQSPEYQSLVLWKPEPYYEHLDIPILALFGEKDVQVPAVPSTAYLEGLVDQFGLEGVKHKTYLHANHLFQHAQTGLPLEYRALSPEFVEDFLEDIEDWLEEVTEN